MIELMTDPARHVPCAGSDWLDLCWRHLDAKTRLILSLFACVDRDPVRRVAELNWAVMDG